MTKTAKDYRQEAHQALQRREDSWDRSDTDGFLTQYAAGLSAQLANRKAEILENNGLAEFAGLYEITQSGHLRRVKARLIDSKFGTCWLIHEDEMDLIIKRGRQFVPTGKNSRVQRSLGLCQHMELAPAWAKFKGRGTGLSGTCWVETYRTGDKWGLDSKILD